MRFVADGPDIPNSLITQWRQDGVVFIAGAGVSVPQPSNLPSFRRLALDVYKALHDPLFDSILQAQGAETIEKRNKVIASRGLSAQRIVEAGLFFRGEYDRLFAALEARLDQNPKGLMVSRKVRDGVESILRTHGGHGAGHRDLIRISTASRLTSNPTSGGTDLPYSYHEFRSSS
jgi:hypothetical protein